MRKKEMQRIQRNLLDRIAFLELKIHRLLNYLELRDRWQGERPEWIIEKKKEKK